ncbi:hypothetical protein F441_14530 [Phytophthora nicotianae CJ01A1]|uniref:Uncharacterized protein n=2 Tax=Phytophthora nicotianae TaxID=4792 RepID=W2IGC7_PHYNI|nr:hypothetical protein L915_14291 [Phytophthora nicotianae]ETL33309.1 hypothetical protein L916_14196 [Phytophthora nicotianae]ETP09652.1 hypothetical protein F441_14530 [Phytophthora nicotianae CJ01A1]
MGTPLRKNFGQRVHETREAACIQLAVLPSRTIVATASTGKWSNLRQAREIVCRSWSTLLLDHVRPRRSF